MQIIILILVVLGWVVFYAISAFALLFLLRVLLAWAGVNPFAKIPYHLTRITEPTVRPLRYQFSGRATRYDLLPLVAGVLLFFVGLIVADTIWQVATILSRIERAVFYSLMNPWFTLKMLILMIGDLYVLAILLRLILPFVGIGYGNRFYRFLFRITEPLLRPLRKYLTFGMFDMSPMVALLLVRLAMSLVDGITG
ncbi:MAG: YggT family protein [Acidobacteria bacterium]|nr:YggT family protein [Acidobacteriota bacterium]